MSMNGAPQGRPEHWELARVHRAELQRIRAEEAAKSAVFDQDIARLAENNTGYVIAAELGMERPTVARILKRTSPKPAKRVIKAKKRPVKKVPKRRAPAKKAPKKRTAAKK